MGLSSRLGAQQSGETLRRGAALMQPGHFGEAETVLASIPEKDADYAAAQTLLGYLHLRDSELDEATNAFRKAVAVDARSSAARFGMGTAFSRKGLLADAAEQFEGAFRDPSLEARARSQWVLVFFWLGKKEGAYRESLRLSAEFPQIPEYQSLAGFLSHISGESGNARRYFERALELDPKRLQDYFSIISICRSLKDWEGTLRWIEKAIELDKNQPLLYREQAEVYALLGRTREAELAHDRAQLTMEAEILYARSAKARADGRPADAERLLRQCVQANPHLSKAWTDLGELAQRRNLHEEALRNFLRALEIEPSNLLARTGASLALKENSENAGKSGTANARSKESRQKEPPVTSPTAGTLQDRRSAAAIVLAAVRDFPDNADLLAYLGRIQESSGGSQDAVKTYSVALSIDPLRVQALTARAAYFLGSGEPQRAADDFRRAADLDAANLQAWLGLALAQQAANDPVAAEGTYRQCLAHNPRDPDCTEQLAYMKMDDGDYHEAADLFRAVLGNGRATRNILDSQGYALMRLGESLQSIGLFERSLKDYGPDPWVYFNLGHLYQKSGKYLLAVANYRQARQLSPQDPEIVHNFAFALYLAGDYASALEPFKTAVRLRPGWGLAHFNLAMTYWHLQDYTQALAQARIAQEKGMPGAARVVQILSASLASGQPRTVTVYRSK